MVSACIINPPTVLLEQRLLIPKVAGILGVVLIQMNLLLVFWWGNE